MEFIENLALPIICNNNCICIGCIIWKNTAEPDIRITIQKNISLNGWLTILLVITVTKNLLLGNECLQSNELVIYSHVCTSDDDSRIWELTSSIIVDGSLIIVTIVIDYCVNMRVGIERNNLCATWHFLNTPFLRFLRNPFILFGLEKIL